MKKVETASLNGTKNVTYTGTLKILTPRRPIPRKFKYPLCRFCGNTSRKKTKYDTCLDKRACKRTIIKRIDACPSV